MAQSGVLWVSRIQLIRGFAHTMMTTDLSIGSRQTVAGRETVPPVSFTAGRSCRWKLNRNYDFGVSVGQGAHEPKLLDLTDQSLRLSLRRRPMEMVWPKVVVKGAITQHVVSGG